MALARFEARLELFDDRHRPGIDARFDSQPQRHVIPEEDQIEQLSEIAFTLGPGPQASTARGSLPKIACATGRSR